MSGAARRSAAPGPRSAELALVLALFAAVAVFHVWARTRVVAMGYALGELEKEHAALQARNDALHIELSMMTSPAALGLALRTKLSKLGMAPPDRGPVLAAGPGAPRGGPGRAGREGVGDLSRPAEPALSHAAKQVSRRAAAAGPGADPGTLALRQPGVERERGPLRAGRAPARRD